MEYSDLLLRLLELLNAIFFLLLLIRSNFAITDKQSLAHEIARAKRELWRKNMDSFFNTEELQELCFDLYIEYEKFNNHNNKALLIIELLKYAERHNLLDELICKCRDLRPHIKW